MTYHFVFAAVLVDDGPSGKDVDYEVARTFAVVVWLTCKHPGEDKKQTSSGFDAGKKPDHLQCRQRTTIASEFYHYNTDFGAFQRARRSGGRGGAKRENEKLFKNP